MNNAELKKILHTTTKRFSKLKAKVTSTEVCIVALQMPCHHKTVERYVAGKVEVTKGKIEFANAMADKLEAAVKNKGLAKEIKIVA